MDTHGLLEAALERSPALVATYSALVLLRQAQRDAGGQRVAELCEQLLTGRASLFSRGPGADD